MRADGSGSLMVCNGEIYNHLELRSQLATRHVFKSRSDSEVVLHLHDELGHDCARRLDGMFAFFASSGDSFVAGRDAFGIKPLYFGRAKQGGFLFGSELKALAGACTTFEALAPGSTIDEAGKPRRWFHPRWETQPGTNRQVTGLQLANRLERAVVKRLMSDVPLGVFLSGGLDSSIIAELAARHYPGLMTFAVGVADASDLAAARHVARALGTRHFECVYTISDAIAALPEIIYHLESYDAALIRSSIPCFFLSRLAAEHVKIALTGEGADELFGGYAHFSQISDPDRFHVECARLLRGLHGMNLQRVDRMTMAHGLEGRVPFLDLEFADFAMNVDPRLNLWSGATLEKRLLREGFAERLPGSILRRRKLEFARGSGAESGLHAFAASRVSDRDLLHASHKFPVDAPKTKEELLYREIFAQLFPGEAWRASVARWQPEASSHTTPC